MCAKQILIWRDLCEISDESVHHLTHFYGMFAHRTNAGECKMKISPLGLRSWQKLQSAVCLPSQLTVKEQNKGAEQGEVEEGGEVNCGGLKTEGQRVEGV